MVREQSVRRVRYFPGIGGLFADLGQHLLLRQPLLVTALLPSRKVLLVDRTAVKLGCRPGLNLRQRIQPCHQSFAALAVLQTPVKRVANFTG